MIGLSKKLPERSLGVELHRLLGTLLSKTLSVGERFAIMEEEYEIPMEEELKEDVTIMCNLSQGIKEEGIAIGRELGRELGREEGRELGREEEREEAIRILIEDNLEEGVSEERILEKLKRRYALTAEAADERIRRVAGGNKSISCDRI